jgi:hypothetical protein
LFCLAASGSRDRRKSLCGKLRLPAANAREIVALVGEWDERHLNALSRTERQNITRELDRLHQARRIPMLDGEETFELVQEASGWRVALNWAGGVAVRFQAAIQAGLPLRVTVLPEETRLALGEHVRVTVSATNLSTPTRPAARSQILPSHFPLLPIGNPPCVAGSRKKLLLG